MAREPEDWIPPEILKSQAREQRALALERDRLVRSRSVAKDTILNLPVSVPMPDGEELYRDGASNTLRNNYDQHSEITKGYIQGPPNKTVWDSPDWRDWDPKPCSCFPSSQPRPKSSQSSSTGQLSSWSLHWRSPSEQRSGKSPPSHTRNRCHHHQRHSHPSNSKNSCSSSTSSSSSSCKHKDLSTSSSSSICSSTSSSTSSCAGLIVNSASNSNCGSNNTVTILSSIGGKISNAFSDKVHSCASTSVGGGSGENAWTNPNYNNSSSVMSRINDETKFSPKNSKTNNGSSQQNSKIGKSHSGLNDIARTQSSSVCMNKSMPLRTQENQSPPPPSLLFSNLSNPSNCSSTSSDLLLSVGGQSTPSSLKSTLCTTTTMTTTSQHHEPSSTLQGQNQQLLSLRLTKVDGGTGGYQTACEDDATSFSQNLFKRVNETTDSNRQNFECSILNDDTGNRGGEQCIGDIQCRLEDVQ